MFYYIWCYNLEKFTNFVTIKRELLALDGRIGEGRS